MIKVENLSMRFGSKVLFKNLNLQFNPGCKYGLVGANGSGKSTFIKILSKEIEAECGDVIISSQLKVGFLKQDHFAYENERVIDLVIQGDSMLWKALAGKNELLNCMEICEHQLADFEKIIELRQGYGAESEAAKLLEGLGIPAKYHEQPLNQLSGGYKLRVLLAQVLFSKPEILVLDEPTNHLDLYSIKWLEGYLKNYPGILIISSHDRDFLNQVCTHIVDVDYGKMKIYHGNFDRFLVLKTEESELKQAQLNKNEKKADDLQKFIDRFGAKASKARQAQSKAKLVEKINDEIEAIDIQPSSRRYPSLEFTFPKPSGVSPLKTETIYKSYGSKQVLKAVSFELERGDRLAIIGPNGIGKSTLLEILTDNAHLDQGSFNWGHGVKFAYFPQDHQREVSGEITLLDWLSQFDRSLSQEKIRDMLGRVLFTSDAVHLAVKTLSGGETARLILAKMMLQQANVLIFDEPTNHLDMEAIDELIEALHSFSGTIIFVSHNRHFVSKIANRILEINIGGIKDYRCNYHEYLAQNTVDHLSIKLSERNQKENKESIKNNLSYDEQKKMRSQAAMIKKRLEQAEKRCFEIEEKIKKIDIKMSEEGFYEKTSREEQVTIIKVKNSLEDDLLEAMQEWEKLSHE